MEDKDLKDLFQSYAPDIESDTSFIYKLERAMDSVEMIRDRQQLVRRRQRRAMAVAAAVGFLSGVIASIVLPLFGASPLSYDPTCHLQVECMSNLMVSPIYYWAFIGIISVLMTFTSYDLTLGLQRAKGENLK